MERDPTRLCALLVGLLDVNVIGVVDLAGVPLVVHVEHKTLRPLCANAARRAWLKDRDAGCVS